MLFLCELSQIKQHYQEQNGNILKLPKHTKIPDNIEDFIQKKLNKAESNIGPHMEPNNSNSMITIDKR